MGLLAAALFAVNPPARAADAAYSPAIDNEYPRRLLWGDTHLHSRNSADAYSLGNRNLSPADAYRFARGQELTAHNGMRVQLREPLDFLVVADHAEYLGGYYRFDVGDPRVAASRAGKQWTAFAAEGDPLKRIAAFTGSMDRPEVYPPFSRALRRSVWSEAARTADEYNDPGQFTALIGYEWTSMISGNNLHRVVIYRDGADKAAQLAPFSAQDSRNPRDLWQALARYEVKTGGQVLAIAHNGNLSNGMMFPTQVRSGDPIDADYAALRARWEPLYEVTQVKGDGEAHPFLSPNDEFADFETWDLDNIARSEKKEPWMLKHEYARGALKLGLELRESLGVNPYQFGLIGSTDGHNTFSTTQEDNFFGKFPESEPGQARTENGMANNALWENWRIVASGYAAVWARENTRASIFDAMKRREVYATTGSRIAVRFFGGFDFSLKDTARADYVAQGYARGVPMGGVLEPPAADPLRDSEAAPSPGFLISALKDPDGPNLDRVQIIKGWTDATGAAHERVYDVLWAGDRTPDPASGRLPSIGSTVDLATASYSNRIGAAQLAGYWQDPDFDVAQRAFYYARVLEIPRPRWTAYDAAYFKLDLPADVPLVIQDRAYTSPIWYQP